MITRFVKIFFLLFVASLIIQTGKHFWPSYSFISGIRIDYLSPTIYLSDVIALVLIPGFIIAYRQNLILNFKRYLMNRMGILVSIILLISMLLSTRTAHSQLAALYGIFRLLEAGMFGYMTAVLLRDKNFVVHVTQVVTCCAVFVSLLGILQFMLQRSVGSYFYFLGERTFSVYSSNIAKFALNGEVYLRPYATFPHPNVLAFFLYGAMSMVLVMSLRYPLHFPKHIMIPVSIIMSIALFLTFSRVIIVMTLITLTVSLYGYTKNHRQLQYKALTFGFIGLILTIGFFGSRLFDSTVLLRDVIWRSQLVDIAFAIIRQHGIGGIGVLNFFYHEVSFQMYYSPIFLQPVHNIYLLVLTELGIGGFFLMIMGTVSLLYHVGSKLYGKHKQLSTGILLAMLLTMLVSGMFDHYLLTLQQGRLTAALLIGFMMSQSNSY